MMNTFPFICPAVFQSYFKQCHVTGAHTQTDTHTHITYLYSTCPITHIFIHIGCDDEDFDGHLAKEMGCVKVDAWWGLGERRIVRSINHISFPLSLPPSLNLCFLHFHPVTSLNCFSTFSLPSTNRFTPVHHSSF